VCGLGCGDEGLGFNVHGGNLGGMNISFTLTWEREFKLPWREAGPPNYHDDKVNSDQ